MSSLAEVVRQKIGAGVLPSGEPVNVWTGNGRGKPCSACERRILPSQPEYEVASGAGFTVRFHVGCLGLWEAECRRRGVGRVARRSIPLAG
jgi:hypothetical protein